MTAPVNPSPVSPAEALTQSRSAVAGAFHIIPRQDAHQGLLRGRHLETATVRRPTAEASSRHPRRGDDGVRHWTINGDFLGLKPTGIARYAREITLALDAMLTEQHPLTQDLMLDIVAPREAADPLNLRHIAVSTLKEFRPRLPQVWVQLQLPHRVQGGLLSFCNLAPVRVRKHIVCIHDLQTRTTPDSYGRLFRLAHRLILPSMARRADVVTTVSAYSRSTLVDYKLAPPEKIVVVPNGSDHALRWDPHKAPQSWRRGRPFVLCMGRDEAHKNMPLIWRIAPRLHAIGIDVVVAGAFDSRGLDAQAGGRPANLHCVGRVSDHELARGFSEALGFLFPSRTEGFGLPAVEAMACGCPVIASRRLCLMELCRGAALFADPDDAEGWVEAIRRLSQEPELVETLRRDGHLRAREYGWREAAESYLRLMLQVDQDHAAARDV